MLEQERPQRPHRYEDEARDEVDSDKLERERIENRVKLFVSWGWTEGKARQYIELWDGNFEIVFNLQHAGVKQTARQIFNNLNGLIDIEEHYNQK